MTTFQLISEYPVRARKLFDLIRKCAFQEALALRFGSLEVTAEEIKRSGAQVQIKVERKDPGRDLAGGLVKGKPERSVVIHDWDLERMESNWTRHFLDRGKMVSAEGTVVIEILGKESCRLVERGEITIRVPLLGRKLERKVISHLEQIQPQKVDFIMRQLGCADRSDH